MIHAAAASEPRAQTGCSEPATNDGSLGGGRLELDLDASVGDGGGW